MADVIVMDQKAATLRRRESSNALRKGGPVKRAAKTKGAPSAADGEIPSTPTILLEVDHLLNLAMQVEEPAAPYSWAMMKEARVALDEYARLSPAPEGNYWSSLYDVYRLLCAAHDIRDAGDTQKTLLAPAIAALEKITTCMELDCKDPPTELVLSPGFVNGFKADDVELSLRRIGSIAEDIRDALNVEPGEEVGRVVLSLAKRSAVLIGCMTDELLGDAWQIGGPCSWATGDDIERVQN